MRAPMRRYATPRFHTRTVKTYFAPPSHNIDIVEMSYYVGKSITLFVGFYCGLQWLYYRELLKKKDDDQNQK